MYFAYNGVVIYVEAKICVNYLDFQKDKTLHNFDSDQWIMRHWCLFEQQPCCSKPQSFRQLKQNKFENRLTFSK